MKTIKRTLALVIVFCLMISFVPVALAAAGDITVTVSADLQSGLTVGTLVTGTIVYTVETADAWDTAKTSDFAVGGTLPVGLTQTAVAFSDSNMTATVTVSGTPTTAGATAWTLPTETTLKAARAGTPTGTGFTSTGSLASTISLGTGATITAPTVSGTPTSDSITVNTINAAANGQTAEYGYSTAVGTEPTSWLTNTTISSLNPNTDYYIWARYAANANYNVGAAAVNTTAVRTAMGTGATITAPTASGTTSDSITVTAINPDATTLQTAVYGYSTAVGTEPTSWQISNVLTGLSPNTDYFIWARYAANANYNVGAATVNTTAITTATAGAQTGVTVAAATGLVYTGLPQNLLSTPVLDGGTIYYSTDNGNSYSSTAMPQGTNAVAYIVYYKVIKAGYDDLTGTVPVSITAATLTPGTNFTAPTANTPTYTGNAQNLVTAGTVGNIAGTFTYATTQAGTYGAIPTGTNAGSYTVWYKFTPSSSNYAAYSSTAAISVAISKAATSATVSAVPTSYSKTSTSITVTGLTSSNTTTNPNVEYAISQSSGASATSLTWYSVSSGSRYTFSGLSSNTTYYIYARPAASTNYQAGAVRTSAAIKTTADSSFTTDVKGVTATSASTTSIKVSWTKATPTPTYYYVYYSTSSSFTTSTTDYARVSGSYTSTTITGLDKNTKYYFYVVATLDGYTDSKSSTVNATTGGTSNTTEYFVVNTSESSSKTSSSIDAYEFSDAAVGYAQPDPETFWIHNVYGSTIKGITVKLTGDNKSSFTLSTSKIESQLDKSEETYFTLVPNEGLKKGTYECTITISASTSAVEDYVIDVTFEVGTASLYFSTKKSGTAISSLEFDNAVEGYSISGTQTLYVNNDSGSQLKGVEVAISGTDKSSFKLTGGSLGTIKDGDYASFEIAPVAGLTAGTYTAKLTVSNTTNTKTATMTLSFKVTAGTGTVDTTPTPTASFVDTTSHWAKDYIESLYAQGYVSGIGSNQFAPNNTLTRAQFVQFLYNGFGSGAIASACPFADVDQTAWYKNAVNWAYANGLVTGYSSTEFGPNYPITREQMATIMGRLSEQYGVSLPSTNARAAFADDSDIASYAKDYVYKMQMADIISGKSGNVFDPKGNTTRGEMSKVMYYVLYYAGKIGTAYRVA